MFTLTFTGKGIGFQVDKVDMLIHEMNGWKHTIGSLK
jgi:hypothetical protein